MSGRFWVIFDGPPDAEESRFVEVEDDDGNSVRAGEWKEDPYTPHMWQLGPFVDAKERDALREALENVLKYIRTPPASYPVPQDASDLSYVSIRHGILAAVVDARRVLETCK